MARTRLWLGPTGSSIHKTPPFCPKPTSTLIRPGGPQNSVPDPPMTRHAAGHPNRPKTGGRDSPQGQVKKINLFLFCQDSQSKFTKMAVVHSDSETGADEKLAECLRFIRWFKESYVQDGQAAPLFYEGLLSDAICAAWNAPALKVKMLTLYLHNNDSPSAADFALQLLCDPVRQVIDEHCVLWGWDVTSSHNWHLIVEMVFENFGVATGHVFQEMCELDFPCMILLTRGKGGIDLVGFVPCSPHRFNTVMSLYQLADVFDAKLRPSLARKENSKKQKSLFCGGSWTKVTEAMAIDANMASYRFMNCIPEQRDAKMEEKTTEGRNEDHSQDIDLRKILTVCQMNLSQAGSNSGSPDRSYSNPPENTAARDGKMKIVQQFLLEDLSSRKMSLLD